MGLAQGDPIATSSSLCSSPVLEVPYKQNHVPPCFVVFCHSVKGHVSCVASHLCGMFYWSL